MVTVEFNEKLNGTINEVKEININDLPKVDQVLTLNDNKYRVTLVREWKEDELPERKKSEYVVELELI